MFEIIRKKVQAPFLQSGTGAVLRTVQDRLLDECRVTDFMTTAQIQDVRARTGAVDVTAAIQAAIDASGPYCLIRFPAGVFLVTATLNITEDSVHLMGAGMRATQILFAPTANDTCLYISNGASMVNQGSVRDLGFYSDDDTYVKVALDSVDVSDYVFENICIHGSIDGVVTGTSYWSDATQASIGIRTNGREAVKFINIRSNADQPLVIATNPNSAAISIDHYRFQSLYLTANNMPNVTILDGVNLTNVVFDGAAWVKGTNGLYWVDTTTVGQSESLTLRDVRWEQCEGTTGHIVRVEHNVNLRNVNFDNLRWGGTTLINGIKFRKVVDASLKNISYDQAGVALDFDSTVQNVSLDVIELAHASATFPLTGVKGVTGNIWHEGTGTMYSYLPNTPNASGGVIQKLNPSTTLGFNQLEPVTVTVAANTIIKLSSNELFGILMISAATVGVHAIFGINGTANVTRIMAVDAGGFWGATAAAVSYNIYTSGGEYKLQNNTGSSETFKINFFGVGEH